MLSDEVKDEERRREKIKRYREMIEKRLKELDKKVSEIEMKYEKERMRIAEKYDQIIDKEKRIGNYKEVERLIKEGRYKLDILKNEEFQRKRPILYELKKIQEEYFRIVNQEANE